MNQNEIATILAVSPAHVSGIVEPLRRQGLLRRQRGVSDRRHHVWRLTPTGCAVLDQVLADAAGWTAGLQDRMGPEQAADLAALLHRLLSALKNEPSAASASPPLKRFDPTPDPGCPETGTGTLNLVQGRDSAHNIREPVPVSGQPRTPAGPDAQGGHR